MSLYITYRVHCLVRLHRRASPDCADTARQKSDVSSCGLLIEKGKINGWQLWCVPNTMHTDLSFIFAFGLCWQQRKLVSCSRKRVFLLFMQMPGKRISDTSRNQLSQSPLQLEFCSCKKKRLLLDLLLPRWQLLPSQYVQTHRDIVSSSSETHEQLPTNLQYKHVLTNFFGVQCPG